MTSRRLSDSHYRENKNTWYEIKHNWLCDLGFVYDKDKETFIRKLNGRELQFTTNFIYNTSMTNLTTMLTRLQLYKEEQK